MTDVSFIHWGSPDMASWRYRAETPSKLLGIEMNDLAAPILVFSKPNAYHVEHAQAAKANGQTVIVDFCDDHFDDPVYVDMLGLADFVTCPAPAMAERIREVAPVDPVVIFDPWEFDELEPHCRGDRCLWFGHAVNFASLKRVLPAVWAPLTIVSNVPGMKPWSLETMREEFARADIVLMPASAPYKSANRAIEAIRQGCFVVAEPHPALADFPGIWQGDIGEGIEWASQNPQLANEWTSRAQRYIRQRFSPRTQADAWKSLFAMARSRSTSAAARCAGQAGSTSMASTSEPTSSAIC